MFDPRRRALLGYGTMRPVLDPLERIGIAYVALPQLLFFIGWFRPLPGALLTALLCLSLAPVFLQRTGVGARSGADLPDRSRTGHSRVFDRRAIVLIACIAFAWAALGGAGHLFYANEHDWRLRDAVLRDLAVAAWPPSYGPNEFGFDRILRAPVSYYLPSAALAKLIGVGAADFMLYLWTAFGAAIFLSIALASAGSLSRVLLGLGVLVLFSGMDIVGHFNNDMRWHGLTTHLEWWATLFQYSSHTTQLFWVPNHALGAWVVTAILWRNWRDPRIVTVLPVLFAILPLWSPLSALGIALLMAAVAVYHLRHGRNWHALGLLGIAPALIVFAVTMEYLSLETGTMSMRSLVAVASSSGAGALGVMVMYVQFVALEFGLVALLLISQSGGLLIAAAAVVLLALPLYSFGPGNDLVMRGGIPALMVLALASAEHLMRVDWRKPDRHALYLAAMLIIGAVTPVHEIWRALSLPSWPASTEKSLADVSLPRPLPQHYVARLLHPGALAVLRPSGRVPGTGSAQ